MASAALASGVTGHGLNPTLVMQVVLGKDDVEIKTQVATVFAWLEIWCTPSLLVARAERTWKLKLKQLQQTQTQQRWSQVLGTMSATIAILLDLG